MRPRSGFTLIEVVVALAVASLVILVARISLEAVSASAAMTTRAAAAADSMAVGRVLLRELAASSQAGTDTSTSMFRGSVARADFQALCPVAEGWREVCNVGVTIRVNGTSGSAVELTMGAQEWPIARAERQASLCFLLSAADGGEWISAWKGISRAPLALGVVTDGDTILVSVRAP